MSAMDAAVKSRRSNRGALILVACIYGLVGAFLSFLITRPISIVEPPWYESVYLPLWVAGILFLVVALCIRVDKTSILGLLVTAPPYLAFLAFYLKYTEEGGMERVLRIALLLCFAASGALLNPLLSALAGAIRRRPDVSRTEAGRVP